ncbi:uncharacterized protein F5147DRAFT_784557 [Suillus discolor]|uniref:Uncharacterized protein n=1 Tax=Suillus discolor TaxID=1912936 RepID=A0A9P7JL13_9AGAM|nr:uncharacterized protein F5147DRAFT_784557 [Suillus discolor]KAG2080047.1 hypothetical protein F5147DRAFT_784557 [Suillus discolor]
MSQILITHALRSISPRALPFPCATFPGSTPRVDNTTGDPVAVSNYVPNYIAKRINDFIPPSQVNFIKFSALSLPSASSRYLSDSGIGAQSHAAAHRHLTLLLAAISLCCSLPSPAAARRHPRQL